MSGPAVPPRPARRLSAHGRGAVARLVLAAALVAGCSGGDDAGAGPGAGAGDGEATTTTNAPASPLAAAVRPLPPAPVTPEIPAPGPEPTSLTIETLDVAGAVVRPVGVEENGEMEIPAVDEVGWYRFGPRPGGPGSAVLAAHIAYDGVDGVFRHLDDLAAGDAVAVTLSDGTRQRFVVTEVSQYPKSQLPAAVWVRGGVPQLVLITCGGEFDSAARSYEDNVVAYARPA